MLGYHLFGYVGKFDRQLSINIVNELFDDPVAITISQELLWSIQCLRQAINNAQGIIIETNMSVVL